MQVLIKPAGYEIKTSSAHIHINLLHFCLLNHFSLSINTFLSLGTYFHSDLFTSFGFRSQGWQDERKATAFINITFVQAIALHSAGE